MTQTKQEKFIRLSEARTDKAVFAMMQLHHLTSHHYEFSKQDVEDIISRLRTGITSVEEAFGVQPIMEEFHEPAPKVFEPEELTEEENLQLIRLGPRIDAAMNAITDGDPEGAYKLLLNLMRS